MQRKNLSAEFQRDWEAFLVDRGHKVTLPRGIGCVLQSKNSGGKRYRWLLLEARGKSKTLNRFELEDVEYHLKRAGALNQDAYVVVNFQKPESKAIVLPAASALKRQRILPSKGGIPWNGWPPTQIE